MIQSELVTRVREKNGRLPRNCVEEAVKTFLDQIAQALGCGERVELRGFGAFTARRWNSRTGRNPRTGVAVAVPARVHAAFRPAKEILRKLNSKPT